MFGMSSREFWEEDPQLYWAYRTFYLEKIKNEADNINYKSWLEGSYTYLAVSVALNNAFSKSKKDYPKFNFNNKKQEKNELQEKMEKEKDKNIRQQIEFNYWARL